MKRIAWLTTGGTIACAQQEEGLTPQLDAGGLRRLLGTLIDQYEIKTWDLFTLDSSNIQPEEWQRIAEKVAELIAEYGVACCLMHNREKAEYQDFAAEILSDMEETLAIAREAGIQDQQIILDPGVGFGKTYEHNLIAINRLEELCGLGYPVLLATSRKSVIGTALDLPVDQRVEGTAATSVIGVMKGAAFVRVHDIKENYRAIQMTRAILREGK